MRPPTGRGRTHSTQVTESGRCSFEGSQPGFWGTTVLQGPGWASKFDRGPIGGDVTWVVDL